MKKNIARITLLSLMVVLGLSFLVLPAAYAEGEAQTTGGTNISLSPVSKVLQLSSNSEYEDHITVNNEGDSDMKIEVYAAPYSYVYSENANEYQLGFNTENNFTQITRWITIKDASGNYVKNPTFVIAPHQSLELTYKISTPDNIPAGGQYAVIFAHTLTGVMSTNGIKTEASPGMIIYGRSTEGQTIVSAEISDAKISQTVDQDDKTVNKISASAKIKNTGNVDFSGVGTLKVDGIFGGGHYETTSPHGRISVIPESELVVSDSWDETPAFGIFKVTWTVTAGTETQTIEQLVFINPMPFIIITIILLTIIIVVIIIVVRKRKERRSRLSV